MAATSDKTTIWHWPTLAAGMPTSWTTVFNETAALVFTNITTAANSGTIGDVTITGTVGSILYLGMASNRFDFARLLFSVAPAGGVRVWEYWNGAAWTTLTVTAVAGNTNLIAPFSELTWTPPSDWATTAINAVTNFWVRARVTTLYTTAGTGSAFTPGVIPVLSTLTIAAPETTTRTITSAVLKFDYHIDAANISQSQIQAQTRVSVKLGAAALSYVLDTIGDAALTVANVGIPANQNVSFLVDCTSYFQSNFGAGATQTCDVTFSGGQQIAATVTASAAFEGFSTELILTYSVDESAQDTRVKTVWIPLESNTTDLTTTLASMGTSQIPALDTFLPESTKVYKEITLVVTANSYAGSAGARTLSYALDAAAATAIATMTCTTQSAGAAACDNFYVNLLAMTTNATHDLKFKTSSITIAPYGHLAAYLMVTYTYSHTSSTTILNSLLLPAEATAEYTQASSPLPTVFSFELNIQEPATITLVQSAVLMRWNATGSGDPNVKIGSQLNRAYSVTVANISNISGDFALMQRLDAGAASGAAFTIARGTQTLYAQIYAGNATRRMIMPTSVLMLNYTSGKSTLGAHNHAHTVFNSIFAVQTIANNIIVEATTTTSASVAPTITPSIYWIINMGYWLNWWQVQDQSSFTIRGIDVHAAIQGSELGGVGYKTTLTLTGLSNIITNMSQKYTNNTKLFKRWANDFNASNLLNPKNARAYVMLAVTDTNNSTVGIVPMFMQVTTYHSITFTISGTVTNFNTGGDGSGISVTVYDTTTGLPIGTAVTVAGGGYTLTDVMDSTHIYYAEARQDVTHVGRSAGCTPA